ncbi:L-lactate permease, partial [Salmonella enterica subsp. enterica serovar Virginia]|nr:L-lactate permease [Salmonella enterica subsp. enterica serovar Virginia]
MFPSFFSVCWVIDKNSSIQYCSRLAANTTGGVTGKMISPQSIAIACAAVGLVGKESDLFRFTVKH